MKHKAKKTNSKWCNSNKGGLAFAIKKLNLWNEGQLYSNVKLENRAGGLVYDWDFVALFFKLNPEITKEYLEHYSGFGIVHFRKFIKEQAGFNTQLRKWRRAHRPMDDEKLKKLLGLSKNQRLASSTDMLQYMNIHKEWDDEAMKQFENRVATKKKALEMESLGIVSEDHQSDESQDSTSSFETQSSSSMDAPSTNETTPNKRRLVSNLTLDIPDDKSDFDSVLSSPNAMPLKKRILWTPSGSPSSKAQMQNNIPNQPRFDDIS